MISVTGHFNPIWISSKYRLALSVRDLELFAFFPKYCLSSFFDEDVHQDDVLLLVNVLHHFA